MKIKSILNGFAGMAIAGMVALTPAIAAEEEGGTPHYPIKHPKHVDWSFSGFFGHWDQGQLQRGFKVYKEVCSACHGLELVAFRNLEALGYSEDQIKTIASEYTVMDGPNEEGEMFERAAKPADRFPLPFANKEEAAYANGGAVPPDFSLLAKARAPERGFPTFIFDIFTRYAENGPDYIYSLLTGYEDAPEGKEITEGTHYNPYFIAGETLAMADPLSDDLVEYDDGTPGTVDNYAKDVSAFMMWAAEPSLVERKSLGFKVMLFLLLFALLMYLVKKSVWASLKDEKASAGGGASGKGAAALAGAGGGAIAQSFVSGTGQQKGGKASSASKKSSISKKAASAKKSEPAKKSASAKKEPAKKEPAKNAKAKKEPAKKAAKPGPERLSKPKGKADDLKLISGVGPKLEKTVNSLGFWHFEQIAKWSKKDIAIVDDELSFKGRIQRDDWVKQAKALAKGGEEEYIRVFGKKPR